MEPLNLNIDGFPLEFNFYNDQFPPLDALTYWHFLKNAKTVIEVGCGYSTLLAHKSWADVIAIDPLPRVRYPEISYRLVDVRSVKPERFEKLESGDILFVDSSHIYEIFSDVYYIINCVMPFLKSGVLVHFHDYFGPDGYPEKWKENPEMKKWNENDFLIPFTFSPEYKVLADNYQISKNHNDRLIEMYPMVPHDITENLGAVRGASLWLQKL